MTPLLKFDGVSCFRGGRLLFEELDLEVGAGEALQVSGPNGSGKSSLLRLAAGLLGPAAGRVEAAAVALVDDNLALDRELPLRKAVDFWGGDSGAAIDALGLAKLAEVPVRYLSAGQAKRANLARAASSGVPLWLLDEPANALDSRSLGLLQALIERHRSSGGAVVAASHVPLAGDWRGLELGR